MRKKERKRKEISTNPCFIFLWFSFGFHLKFAGYLEEDQHKKALTRIEKSWLILFSSLMREKKGARERERGRDKWNWIFKASKCVCASSFANLFRNWQKKNIFFHWTACFVLGFEERGMCTKQFLSFVLDLGFWNE